MTPEGELKEAIKEYLNSLDEVFLHSYPGTAYGKKGSPDIVVCYKGNYIGIEAKTYEGKFSEWQKTRKKQIENAGGVCLFVRSVEHVKEYFEGLNE